MWEELEVQARKNALLTPSFVVLMAIAGMIAGIGIVLDSPILIVGAMVVGPDYAPVSAVCVFAVRRRWTLARHALGTLVIALGAAALATFVQAVLLDLTSIGPDQQGFTEGQLVSFISHPDSLGTYASILAGVAGMLSLTEGRSSTLVGVVVSVTTIPAAANIGLAAALGAWDEMRRRGGAAAAQRGRAAGGRCGDARHPGPAHVAPTLTRHDPRVGAHRGSCPVQEAQHRLARRLGLFDAVVIGLGAMIGAGVFAAFGPAAAAAGSGLLIGLAHRGGRRLLQRDLVGAARGPATPSRAAPTSTAGERLGPFWGFLAGWGFVVGKTASCAAMALTFGAYAAPDLARVRSPSRRSWRSTRVELPRRAEDGAGSPGSSSPSCSRSLASSWSVGALVGGQASVDHRRARRPPAGWSGILEAAGLLFFAFAGYARIATLGEEVIDPARTIPRAIPHRARASRWPCTPWSRPPRCSPSGPTRSAARRRRSPPPCEAGSLTRLVPGRCGSAAPSRRSACCSRCSRA